MKALHRLLLASMLTGVGLAALPAEQASAHANLSSSDPSNGAVLAESPARITLHLSEPPDPDFLSVEVVNAGGQQVETGTPVLGTAPRSVETPLPEPLPSGVYTVSWRVVSTADTHQSRGVFAFGVGVDRGSVQVPDTAASETPAPSPLSIVGRALLYVGIVLAIGTAVAGLWLIGPGLAGRRALALTAAATAILGTATMVAAERAVLDVSMGDLLSSSTGQSYVRLLIVAGLTLVAATVAGFTSTRGPLVALGLAGVATAAVRAMGGHAAAASPAWQQELVQTVHIVAASVWIGAFIPILLSLHESRRDGMEAPVREVRRFSNAAGWAVLVVVGTGILRAIEEAGGLGEVRDLLFDTTYGTALIVKVAVVIGLVALGWFNRRRSILRLGSDLALLTRVMTVEAVGALVVLATTGLLTGLNPEDYDMPASHAPPTSISAAGADFATTVRVELTATPGHVGPNDFEARVTDYDSNEPVPATAVSLTFEPVGRAGVDASQLDLAQDGSGIWTGQGSELSLAGVWNVSALVQTGARATDVPLVLTTRAPGGQTSSVISQEGLPDITTLALPGDVRLDCYIDPGSAGANDIHVTAFDATGDELALEDLLVVVTPAGGEPEAVDAQRLTPGHFSVPTELASGAVRVDVVATSHDGAVVQGWFGQEIGGEKA